MHRRVVPAQRNRCFRELDFVRIVKFANKRVADESIAFQTVIRREVNRRAFKKQPSDACFNVLFRKTDVHVRFR